MFATLDSSHPSPVLQWDRDSRYLLPAETNRLSIIESVLMGEWQDHLDAKLGWEHPQPNFRVPLLAQEFGVHTCLMPQEGHEQWFVELFGRTTEVHVGADHYEVNLLNLVTFDESGAVVDHPAFKVRALNTPLTKAGISYDGRRVAARFLNHVQVETRRRKKARKKR